MPGADAVANAGEVATVIDTTPQPKMKVLVIDDSPTIVELVRHVVGTLGKYDVVVAYDGAQGLERFYEEQPDCVIADVNMPHLDGYQLVRCIRGDSRTAHTPLIILSAMTEGNDRLTGLLSGVDEYVAKPFKNSNLAATIERVLRITPEEREQRIAQLAAEPIA